VGEALAYLDLGRHQRAASHGEAMGASTAQRLARPRRRALVASALLVAVSLLAAPGLGRAEGEAEVGFRQLRQQGIHYFDRKRYSAAVHTLKQAAATVQGQRDFKTHFYLARAHYELVVVEEAMPEAELALEVSRTPIQEDKAQSFLDALNASFGAVTFRKDPEQKTKLTDTYIHLKDRGGLINPAKKKLFQAIQERSVDRRVKLPVTLYLPFGSYTANGAPFEIRKGEPATANLFLYGAPPSSGIAWYWWVGGAATVAAGTAALLVVLLSQEEEVQTARFEPVGLFGEAE